MDAATLMSWLTGLLALATFWLAVETRRLAGASKAQIELQTQPHLAFRGFNVVVATTADLAVGATSQGLRLGLELSNPGNVLVTYEMVRLSSTLGDVSLESPSFVTKGGVVHPGAQTVFLLPPASVNLANGSMAPSGDVEFSISYWSTPEKKSTLHARVRFQLLSVQPLDWQWVYLSGPTYA